MYRQPAGASQLPHHDSGIPDIARSGQLDALVALERIGSRLRFLRNQEIYGQGESGGCWYKVISGTVRISKLRTDGPDISLSSALAATGSALRAARIAVFRPKRSRMSG
jgi:CRP-like cAMP-binding protein